MCFFRGLRLSPCLQGMILCLFFVRDGMCPLFLVFVLKELCPLCFWFNVLFIIMLTAYCLLLIVYLLVVYYFHTPNIIVCIHYHLYSHI